MHETPIHLHKQRKLAIHSFFLKKTTMSEDKEIVVENVDSISIHAKIQELPKSAHVIAPLDNMIRNSHNNKVLLILNQDIQLNIQEFSKIWDSCEFKVCADGGLNRLYNFDKRMKYVPDYLIGDLDSVNNDIRKRYEKTGIIKTIKQSCQYSTDLMKAFSLINCLVNFPHILDSEFDPAMQSHAINGLIKLEDKSYQSANTSLLKPINLIILGGIGGRFDQTISTIHQIFNMSISRPIFNFTIVNPEHSEFIVLIKKGITFVRYPMLSASDEIELLGTYHEKSKTGLRNVGILPLINNNASISTFGLKWDVRNWKTNMQTKLSTSNLQVGNEGFIIESNEQLFLTLEI